MKRPPIIVVVGHVDHGKTTLLDYIRKTTVAAREAGGITQSTGAYEVEHHGQKLTFIDTPGHEAFRKMRERGAHVADIAILVVGADDGVQQQTKEAIKILEATKTPFVVAITKIDKALENIDKVKNDLMQSNVFLEGYGGSVSWHGVSAKTGEGINELLDLLLLTADVEELTYDPSQPAEGFILEAKRDSRRGIVVMGIVTDGTLRVDDAIHTGNTVGKVRALENCFRKSVKELTASSPVVIFGFATLPNIGDTFSAGGACLSGGQGSFSEGRRLPEGQLPDGKVEHMVRKMPTSQSNDARQLNLILCADVSGSLEALKSIMQGLPNPKGLTLSVVGETIGTITDGDVNNAIAHNAMIVGFNVEPTKAAAMLARNAHIAIITSNVVYDLTKAIEELLQRGGAPEPKAILDVLAIFGKKEGKRLVGGRVTMGELRRGLIDIMRGAVVVGKGKIVNLQSGKKEVDRVKLGEECGMLIESDIEPVVEDKILLK